MQVYNFWYFLQNEGVLIQWHQLLSFFSLENVLCQIRMVVVAQNESILPLRNVFISSLKIVNDTLFMPFFWLINSPNHLVELFLTSVKGRFLNLKQLALSQQDSLLDGLNHFIPEPEAALVGSMIFGNAVPVDEMVSHYFEVTGMQHVVAASGSNVSLILMLATLIFSPFLQNKLALSLVSLVSLSWYSLMAGAQPPLVRAALMIFLFTLSQHSHQQTRSWYRLFVGGVLMLVIQPSLVESLSFQLSVLATLSVCLFAERFTHTLSWLQRLELGQLESMRVVSPAHWWRRLFSSVLRPFQESLTMTLSAQILVLPLLLVRFGQLSAVSLVANTLLLWLVPLITLSGVGLILGLSISSWNVGLHTTIGVGGGWIVYQLTHLFLSGMAWFGSDDTWLVEIHFARIQLVGWYLLVCFWWIWPSFMKHIHLQKHRLQVWRNVYVPLK